MVKWGDKKQYPKKLEIAIGFDAFQIFLMKNLTMTQGSLQIPDVAGHDHIAFAVCRGSDDVENLGEILTDINVQLKNLIVNELLKGKGIDEIIVNFFPIFRN